MAKKIRDSLFFLIALALATSYVQAQGTTRYVYDDNGRLIAVIAPNGEANIYEYDAAGNFTAIRRNSADDLEVLDFKPRRGVPGTQVTIIGTGFGAGVSSVDFNGTTAQIVSVNSPTITVTVPNGATTGPISVTTPGGTVTTSQPFTIKGISVMPPTATVLPGQTIQFTAAVVLSGDQSVVWSVNGIEGGNSSVGTITTSGLYIAPNSLPNKPLVKFRVVATSLAESEIYGESSVTVRNTEFLRFAFAQALSIRNGSPPTIIQTPVFASLVSIRNGSPPTTIQVPTYIAAVSVTKGPSISAISPIQVSRGLATDITLSGANLSGTTALNFFDLTNNVSDNSITVSNISVNGAGSSLTATLTISDTAALGRRVVIITSSDKTSQKVDVGINVIEVIP